MLLKDITPVFLILAKLVLESHILSSAMATTRVSVLWLAKKSLEELARETKTQKITFSIRLR